MAILRRAAATRNAELNAVRDRLDSGGAAGTLKIYSGTMPSDGESAAGTLLATLTLAYPCAPDASGGDLTFAAITEDTSADASGTATWARLATSTGAAVFDVDVGATGSGAAIEMNSTAIVAGGPVRVTAFVLSTVP